MPIIRTLSVGLVTVLGSGYSPVMPGSAGSLLACLLAGLIVGVFDFTVLLWIGCIVLPLSWGAIALYNQYTASHDASEIVVDELLGMWLLLWLWQPQTWQGYMVCFLVFRFFDIVKPFPIRWFDRNLSNAAGVIFDDLLAALYAALVLWISHHYVAL